MPGSKSPWVWDDKSRRYRSTETGRWLGSKQMITLRDRYIEAKKSDVAAITERYFATGDRVQWVADMRETIKRTYIDEYVLARGGRSNMTQADWGRIGAMTRKQYEFLAKFEQDLIDGKTTQGQAQVRAGMYVESASQAFERGKSEAAGMPALPQYPGDGRTICKSNCHCHWEIRETPKAWEAYWELGHSEHCPDCVNNAGRWAPLRMAKP